MALPIYNSSEVKVAWGGVLLGELAKDSFVTMALNSPVTYNGRGADGHNQVSISADRSGTVTVSTQSGSKANWYFSAAVNYLRATGKLFVAPLTITDPSGSALVLAKGAHIMEAPEITLSEDHSDNTYDWVFFSEEIYFSNSPEGIATAIAQSDIDQIAGAVETLKQFATL